MERINLDNITMVLNEPHYPENIGGAARAIKNMGIKHLVLVNPIDCDLTRVLKMATHNAEDIVSDMEVYDNLEEALSPYQYIVGTTARLGAHRQSVRNPKQLALELVPISAGNRVAILFGTESSGLTNEHLKFCDALVTVPTAGFSSINLAQSVMIMSYELFTATSKEKRPLVPRLADRNEVEGMYEHLQDTLKKINFINPENPDYWMMSVRQFFSRMMLQGRDIRLIRGICRQIDWYCTKRTAALQKEEI
ncbi:MAG: RNA methyltransferase [Syntrophobacteraceae bacterium]